jgi:L-ascorbate metabolism protein UlaG (beta-lactamase superfamily)
MANYEISFINHSSLSIVEKNITILTDPWFISPAFGTWYQNPSPNYEDIEKIVKKESSIFTVISHGHDDHLDDFFIKNYLKNSQILITNFKSKGFLKRVSKISSKTPIEIEQNFTPIKLNGNSFYSYSNKEMKNDSIILISNDDELIIHANDNYREQPKEIIDKIKEISKNKKIYYFSQVGIASSFPAKFSNLHLKKKKK